MSDYSENEDVSITSFTSFPKQPCPVRAVMLNRQELSEIDRKLYIQIHDCCSVEKNNISKLNIPQRPGNLPILELSDEKFEID